MHAMLPEITRLFKQYLIKEFNSFFLHEGFFFVYFHNTKKPHAHIHFKSDNKKKFMCLKHQRQTREKFSFHSTAFFSMMSCKRKFFLCSKNILWLSLNLYHLNYEKVHPLWGFLFLLYCVQWVAWWFFFCILVAS